MKGTRMTIADLPPRYRAQIEAQLTNGNGKLGQARAQQVRSVQVEVAPEKKRLRQKREPEMNKTEAAFWNWLKTETTTTHNTAQSITLKLANGVRYTPDFVSVIPSGNGRAAIVTAYEVKGFMRDDAAVKLKVAARAYPWIQFNLVTRDGAGWKIEEVLP